MDSTFVILVAVAFLTATLSGILGMGGGVLLLSVMAIYFSPAVLIPFHGTVQLASNVSRLAVGWRAITWPILLPMLAGCGAGALAGSAAAISLPETGFQFAMGLFILVVTWAPQRKRPIRFPGKFFWVGAVSTALSFVVGATGVLTAPFFLNEGLTRESIVATRAGGQMATHLLKVGVFSALGFHLAEYWALVLGMVIAAALGSALGKVLLGRLSERVFLILFRGLITVLAGRMLVKSTVGWFS